MSGKPNEGSDKMSVEYVSEAKGMAEFITRCTYRGPGDTIDAAMHRAERQFGVSAAWLHRLRYRNLKDIPVSVFFSIFEAYRAASEASETAYEAERKMANARNSKLVGLADFVARKKVEA